jgi:hypothetical protein
MKADDDHFIVRVSVAVSSQFLSWIIALEGKVKIISPDNVKDAMESLISLSFTE